MHRTAGGVEQPSREALVHEVASLRRECARQGQQVQKLEQLLQVRSEALRLARCLQFKNQVTILSPYKESCVIRVGPRLQAREAENEALQQALNLADFKYELLVDLVSSSCDIFCSLPDLHSCHHGGTTTATVTMHLGLGLLPDGPHYSHAPLQWAMRVLDNEELGARAEAAGAAAGREQRQAGYVS